MIKTTLLGSTLAVALSAGPAMAADFQALADLQVPAPTPLMDAAVTATEGGAACVSILGTSVAIAGAAICESAIDGASGSAAAGGIDALPAGIAVGFVALGVVTDAAVPATERRATCTSGGSTVTAAAICGSAIDGASGSTAAGGLDGFPSGISVGFSALGVVNN